MFMNSASGVTLFRDLGNTLPYTVVYTVYTSHSVSTGFGAWGRDESRGESLRLTCREPGWSTSHPQGWYGIQELDGLSWR
jgi:hypothetical protein